MPPEGINWWDEIPIRASGEVVCEECDKKYWRHAKVSDDVPTLVRACDGRLLKL